MISSTNLITHHYDGNSWGSLVTLRVFVGSLKLKLVNSGSCLQVSGLRSMTR